MEQLIFTTLSADELKTLFREVLIEFKTEQELLDKQSKKSKPEEVLLNPSEVTALLRISKVTLQKWCVKGHLKKYTLGRKVFFKKSEILEALESPKVKRRL